MRFDNFNVSGLIGGGLFVAIGAFAIVEASTYPIGHLNRMGPGYLPLVLGVLLVGLGVGIAVQGAGRRVQLPKIQLRALLAISSAIVGFGLVADHFGLIPATLVVVILSSLADRRFRPIAAIATAVGLAAFSYLVFIEGLGVSMKAFNWG